jgi:ribose/xylose/arabinose/galactoside ABC-type transport system permease subunit
MNVKKIFSKDPDLAFAVILSVLVFSIFAFSNPLFFTLNTGFAIMERFAVLGLVGLALTLCIIAGEIDLSIGSNAALAAVIVVRFADDLGAPTSIMLGVVCATLIGATQGYLIAYLKVRAIVLTVGTLMLLRGVSLFAADERTVMLTDFTVTDFIQTKMGVFFSPASILVIVLCIVVGLFMRYTKYGREIYAIGGARKEAVASGVSLNRPMILVFALSGFCAGVGGAIIGLRSGTAQPLALQYLLLAATVAAFIGGVSILGGKGGVVGAIVGTLTVNFLNTGLVFNITPAYVVQIYLGILLLTVILFQTMSVMYEDKLQRRLVLFDTDQLRRKLTAAITKQ